MAKRARPTPPAAPTTLDELAAQLEDAADHTHAVVEKERIEAESKTKLRPRKAQAEPQGLFEQQRALF